MIEQIVERRTAQPGESLPAVAGNVFAKGVVGVARVADVEAEPPAVSPARVVLHVLERTTTATLGMPSLH